MERPLNHRGGDHKPATIGPKEADKWLSKMLSIGGAEALQELGDQMALLRRDPGLQRLHHGGARQRPQLTVAAPSSDIDQLALSHHHLSPHAKLPPLQEIGKIGRALEGVVSKQHFLQLRRRCLLSDLYREYNAAVQSRGQGEGPSEQSAQRLIPQDEIVVRPAQGVSYASHVRKALIGLIWPDDGLNEDRRSSADGQRLYAKRLNQWNAWQREGRVYHHLEQSFGRGVLAFIPSTFRLPE